MNTLLNTVVKNNYCIGCGVCSAVSNYNVDFNKYGQYQAVLEGESNRELENAANLVCPFSNNSLNEDQISQRIFDDNLKNEFLGSYNGLYFGYSKINRKYGASGGLTTWFILKLLENKIIDGVIHLKENRDINSKTLFKYDISHTKEEVLDAAKTKYYPGELSEVINEVLNKGEKKYVLVGVPCFVKSVRLLAEQNDIIKNRIVFYVGLVCGHFKSANYSKMLAFQKGVPKGEMTNIDFRHKTGKGLAGSYNTKISFNLNSEKKEINQSVKNFYGTDWGLGMFKYNACDYCDDVVAETADIAFGDAWIAPYNKDPNGTNMVITRNKLAVEIIKKGIEANEIHIDNANPEQIIKTQSAGLRHRREGLKVRLKNKKNEWYPIKRVHENNKKVSFRYKIIYLTRSKLSKYSHIFFEKSLRKNSFFYFKFLMFPLVFFYKYILYAPGRLKILYLKLRK
ncbi:Coenzyme F420 hydrogenase/dehydrogenase, beta subunit C-terminal domain [Lutibacter sp. TH_r2]|uniref:Coenzyme F420 hydrogenase/dehydrogenase, beta subunit C-terminal domain n=1 Tax=Lutibacter sp. TH_r2 TaxID=3082083 RepID=UPI0029539D77|nr:Coenzyme F420 hydrogenase/dehydrogenase, beta subunit C-terminal domain [Lutibacter sp. TH_r2]MDV7187801.1 Coenzyme F420 hydrogenase/dehydrogenase, beta subunit C-terminal domain [Lutibacter sp. TH_r2]